MRTIARLGAGAAVFLSATTAFAHHPGGVGNTGDAGPITTISATTLQQGQAVAGVVVDYSSLKTLSDARLTAAASAGEVGVHGLRTIQAMSLSAAYGVTSDLTLGLRLPVVRRTGIRAAEDDGTGTFDALDHGNATGLGDLTILGQYRFVHDRSSRFEAALLAGLTAPTGATGRRSRQGELLDAEFQPGSGSWNELVGLALTKRSGPWSFDTNVLYVRAGDGTQNTNIGDQVLANAAISYRLTGFATNVAAPMYHGAMPHDHVGPPADSKTGPKLDLVLELNGEWHAKQTTAGVADANSGGTTVYLAPGVRISQDRWSGFLSVGVPVVRDTNGLQPEPDWRIRSGIGVAF